jgi:hypothetical protein
MQPTAHFFSGVVVYSLLVKGGLIPRSIPDFLLIVVFALIVDWDFVVSRMHRQSFTHTPAFWLLVSSALILVSPLLWIVLPVVLIHLLLDTLDWGVMVAWPFSSRTRGLKILAKEVEGRKLATMGYSRVYLGNRIFIAAEAILAITALGLLVSIA